MYDYHQVTRVAPENASHEYQLSHHEWHSIQRSCFECHNVTLCQSWLKEFLKLHSPPFTALGDGDMISCGLARMKSVTFHCHQGLLCYANDVRGRWCQRQLKKMALGPITVSSIVVVSAISVKWDALVAVSRTNIWRIYAMQWISTPFCCDKSQCQSRFQVDVDCNFKCWLYFYAAITRILLQKKNKKIQFQKSPMQHSSWSLRHKRQ